MCTIWHHRIYIYINVLIPAGMSMKKSLEDEHRALISLVSLKWQWEQRVIIVSLHTLYCYTCYNQYVLLFIIK